MSASTIAEAERQADVLDVIARDDVLFAITCLHEMEALLRYVERQAPSLRNEALLPAIPDAIAALERAVKAMAWSTGAAP